MSHNILICLDGSRLAEQIIPSAIESAAAFNSEVTLLQVVQIPAIPTPGVPGAGGVPIRTKSMMEQFERDKSKARAYLEDKARLFQEKGLSVESIVLEGTAGPAIVSYARDNEVNLIAMATHGHGGLAHLVFGSVAEFVLRESGMPILLIRPQSLKK